MNNPTMIGQIYDDFTSGNVYSYGFNQPNNKDTLLSRDQSIQNYLKLNDFETSLQGYLFFSPSTINLDDDNYDYYMIMAVASGANNFLQSNGFPNIVSQDVLSTLQQAINSLPYPVNINFNSNFPSDPTVGPTVGPSPFPTGFMPKPSCPPCPPFNSYLSDPTPSCPAIPTMPSCPKKEKLSVGKQLYFSFLGALIFLLLSLPFIYNLTDSVFGELGLNTKTQYGCPTYTGIIIHFVFYFLLVFGLMKLFE
jgi:hypothetical protein